MNLLPLERSAHQSRNAPVITLIAMPLALTEAEPARRRKKGCADNPKPKAVRKRRAANKQAKKSGRRNN